MEIILNMKMKLKFNEDMDMEADVKEAFRNGDIGVGDIECSIVDEDGNNILDGDENAMVAEQIMMSLMGGVAE